MPHAAYGPHGAPNDAWIGPYAQSGGPPQGYAGGFYDAGQTQGGVPPGNGPVMGYPQGGNTYIPGWGRRRRPLHFSRGAAVDAAIRLALAGGQRA